MDHAESSTIKGKIVQNKQVTSCRENVGKQKFGCNMIVPEAEKFKIYLNNSCTHWVLQQTNFTTTNHDGKLTKVRITKIDLEHKIILVNKYKAPKATELNSPTAL